MEIPFSRWYPLIATRRSRRQFDASLPVSLEIISNLQNICGEFKPFPGARVEVVPRAPDKIFNFIAGSYGAVKNAWAALVFLGNTNNRHTPEEVGYTGEGIVLEACALGLSTCWMAGTFRPGIISDFVNIRSDEKVLAVSPLGYAAKSISLVDNIMASFGRHSLRKPLSSLVSGLPENEWQPWIKPALESARLAPSAVNRQPWRFKIEPKAIIVSTDGGRMDYRISKRLDCGIAMLHLEVAALNQEIKGQWQLLEEPQVARFIT
jgi:nitroreductase